MTTHTTSASATIRATSATRATPTARATSASRATLTSRATSTARATPASRATLTISGVCMRMHIPGERAGPGAAGTAGNSPGGAVACP